MNFSSYYRSESYYILLILLSFDSINVRYLIDDDRAIFMFKDGSRAWEAKDFLIEQEECKEVTIESKVYPGKYPDKINPAVSPKEEL